MGLNLVNRVKKSVVSVSVSASASRAADPDGKGWMEEHLTV